MRKKRSTNRIKIFAISLLAAVILNANHGFAQNPTKGPQTQSAAGQVSGSGTTGQLVKWEGASGQNTFTIGDSVITEDKFGRVGIGIFTPTSKLSVAGTIESLSGGFKFPDGSIQTTAGLANIFRDATLIGNGTSAAPLGIAAGGVGTLQLANGAVIGQKIANGNVVRSFNGLFDNIQLAAGANITITPTGNTLTIAATDILTSVLHDATLIGNGASGSLLGIANSGVNTTQLANNAVTMLKLANGAVTAAKLNTTAAPVAGQFLSFDGSSLIWQSPGTLIGVVTDTTLAGDGTASAPLRVAVPLTLKNPNPGGTGVFSTGGDNSNGRGGDGIQAFGGQSSGDTAGDGIFVIGGESNSAGDTGGSGIFAIGGLSNNGENNGLAGVFLGGAEVIGNFNVSGGGTKNFKIDHPLDPANKYLYHAAIESSEVLNVYSGNITTDANGEATVVLPDWFEAINKDCRYQLTVIGAFAQAIVAGKVKNNRFTIRTSTPGLEVSWQVTGVRSDAAMVKHPFKIEEEKSARERGHYLAPDAYGQPEEMSIQWARQPEAMKQMKERQEQSRRRNLEQ